MKREDPYRAIAWLFPVFNRLMERLSREIRRDLISLLERHRIDRVMDLGCGAGDFSRLLADRGYRPVCVDLSPSMLKLAACKARLGAPFGTVRADGGLLPFHAGFDAVLMRFVFHEMSPEIREAVWKEMSRVLRAGGLVIFLDFTISPESGFYPSAGRLLIRTIEKQMSWIHAPHYENYREFMRRGALVSWLKNHGGELIEDRRYLGGNLGLVAAIPLNRLNRA